VLRLLVIRAGFGNEHEVRSEPIGAIVVNGRSTSSHENAGISHVNARNCHDIVSDSHDNARYGHVSLH
jgi:hypothetical protein